MNIQKSNILISLIFFMTIAPISAEPVITTFLQHPPLAVIKSVKATLAATQTEKLDHISKKSPSKINKKLLEAHLSNNIIPTLSNFLVTYYGYIDYSNKSGQIIVPLEHSPATQINVLITPNINLEKIEENTIGYRYIPDTDTDSMFYSYEQKTDKGKDGQKNILYWEVKKAPLPKNKIIPPTTLTIVTKAKNLFVEEGAFLREENSNLVLPNNIYVIGSQSNVKTLLNTLDTAQYFEPVAFDQKKANETVNQSIVR